MAWKFALKQFSKSHACSTMALALTLAACGSEPQATLAADPATARHSEALKAGECDLEGTWAIKISVPVRWAGSMVLSRGEGELTQFVKSKRVRAGNVINETLYVCGISLPDYRSIVGQKFATRFPASLFDDEGQSVAPIQVSSHFDSFTPGAAFQTDSVVSELGVAMPNPLTDTWPARGTDLQHTFDADNDGNPGVTLVADTSAGYSLPPTRFPNYGQATKFYTAIRNIANISGTQQTCDLATGKAVIPKIGNKAALNSHVLGCELAGGGQCGADQTRMLDVNQPGYQPIDGKPGTVVMMRVDDDATCETVRDYDFVNP